MICLVWGKLNNVTHCLPVLHAFLYISFFLLKLVIRPFLPSSLSASHFHHHLPLPPICSFLLVIFILPVLPLPVISSSFYSSSSASFALYSSSFSIPSASHCSPSSPHFLIFFCLLFPNSDSSSFYSFSSYFSFNFTPSAPTSLLFLAIHFPHVSSFPSSSPATSNPP